MKATFDPLFTLGESDRSVLENAARFLSMSENWEEEGVYCHNLLHHTGPLTADQLRKLFEVFQDLKDVASTRLMVYRETYDQARKKGRIAGSERVTRAAELHVQNANEAYKAISHAVGLLFRLKLEAAHAEVEAERLEKKVEEYERNKSRQAVGR